MEPESLEPLALQGLRHSEQAHQLRADAARQLLEQSRQLAEGLLGLAGAAANGVALGEAQVRAIECTGLMLQHAHGNALEQVATLATDEASEVPAALQQVAELSTATARRLGELLEEADA